MNYRVSSKEILRRRQQALREIPADLVVRNVRILDLYTGDLIPSDIAVTGNIITGTEGDHYRGMAERDGGNRIVVPGFFDTHVHIESSMITPQKYDELVAPLGTTTVICDPHEIGNVLGTEGIKYFQTCSEATLIDLYVNLSSCVPASTVGTSGARIDVDDLVKISGHKSALGLAEFMNPSADPCALAKLAEFSEASIDGHLPLIRGSLLNALMSGGIRNDHECVSLPEALEKLRKGLHILIRQGTVSKNLPALAGLITPEYASALSFCTDDRNIDELKNEGHINFLIKEAIRLGAQPHIAYRVASLSAAQHFGLDRNSRHGQARGLVGPGRLADFILLDDLTTCEIHSVYKGGQLITPELFHSRPHVAPVGYNSIRIREIVPNDLKITAEDYPNPQNVVGYNGTLITDHLVVDLENEKGTYLPDIDKDLIFHAVIERHGINGKIATGFVHGLGIADGAIAGSVGHDDHNLASAGSNLEDMALAINTVRKNQGGYAVVKNGEVLASLPLPIAGLMSDHEDVHRDFVKVCEAAQATGTTLHDVFTALSFLSLGVIPKLKRSNEGEIIFDPEKGDQEPKLIRPAISRRSALQEPVH